MTLMNLHADDEKNAGSKQGPWQTGVIQSLHSGSRSPTLML